MKGVIDMNIFDQIAKNVQRSSVPAIESLTEAEIDGMIVTESEEDTIGMAMEAMGIPVMYKEDKVDESELTAKEIEQLYRAGIEDEDEDDYEDEETLEMIVDNYIEEAYMQEEQDALGELSESDLEDIDDDFDDGLEAYVRLDDEPAMEGKVQSRRVKAAKVEYKMMKENLNAIKISIKQQQKKIKEAKTRAKTIGPNVQYMMELTRDLDKMVANQVEWTRRLNEAEAVIKNGGYTAEEIEYENQMRMERQAIVDNREKEIAVEKALNEANGSHKEEMSKIQKELESQKEEAAKMMAETTQALTDTQALVEQQKAQIEELMAKNAQLARPMADKVKDKTLEQINKASEFLKNAFANHQKLQTVTESFVGKELLEQAMESIQI